MNFEELIQEVEQLPIADKWQLVKRVLHSLEESKIIIEPDWHQFVHEMYGSLRDTDLMRWEIE